MKKIAILLRGHVRSYKKTVENFLKFIDCENLQVDIFIHTWDTVNYDTIEPTNIDEIKYLYNPINICVDSQLDISTKPIFYKNANRAKFKFQLYSIYILKEMMTEHELKNNFKYDYVIHTRFDLAYIMNLNEVINLLENNNIVTHFKLTYYDLFCAIDRQYIELYSNMILQNFKKIKKQYKMYGINPIIDFNIKNLSHSKTIFARIIR